MADQLCTTAQVKTRLGITDATDDAVISEIIDQVTDEIQQFTHRKLVPDNAATYTFDTARGSTLRIGRGIRTVTAMSIASTDQPDAGGAYTAVTLADVLLRPLPIDRRPGWPATEIRLKHGPLDPIVPLYAAANGATVTGDFGFAATPPAAARIAIGAVVAEYLDRRRSGKAGEDGIDLPGLLNSSELAMLARFRAVAIG